MSSEVPARHHVSTLASKKLTVPSSSVGSGSQGGVVVSVRVDVVRSRSEPQRQPVRRRALRIFAVSRTTSSFCEDVPGFGDSANPRATLDQLAVSRRRTVLNWA